MGPRPCLCFTLLFHTKVESRFLQIDHQNQAVLLQLALPLPTPKCRSCRGEGHLSLQTSSFILPIGVSVKNALFQPKKQWNSAGVKLGSSAQGMKNYCAKKMEVIGIATWIHGIKKLVYMFLFELKKKHTFLGDQKVVWLQNIRFSVLTVNSSKSRLRLTLTFPFGISHFQALSWRIEQGHLAAWMPSSQCQPIPL